MKTTLYLIRHGETDWNIEGRWQGHADVPLNDVGKRQAGLLANHLRAAGVRFDGIYSSDLSRAYQTAWPIGAVMSVPVQLFPPLREIDLGTWSGLTGAEVRARHPIEFALLEQGQDIPRGGAETNSALARRVVDAVAALAAKHPGETLALVGHGGSVRALLLQAATAHMQAELRPHHLGNTSVSVMHWDQGTWELVSFNDLTHLTETAQAAALVTTPRDDAEQPAEGYV